MAIASPHGTGWHRTDRHRSPVRAGWVGTSVTASFLLARFAHWQINTPSFSRQWQAHTFTYANCTPSCSGSSSSKAKIDNVDAANECTVCVNYASECDGAAEWWTGGDRTPSSGRAGRSGLKQLWVAISSVLHSITLKPTNRRTTNCFV